MVWALQLITHAVLSVVAMHATALLQILLQFAAMPLPLPLPLQP
jgi:hypothetical protein